jgi:DNA modification methylase
VNTIELGKHGRYRTNLWSNAGVNTLKRDRMAELAMHPTVKPVALVSDAIKDVSRRGDVVLDPFGGSGSTLIAAERTGRHARLIEIDPVYCDVIVRRWAALTGGEALLAGSERRFGEIAAERLAAAEQPAAEVA